MELAAEPHRLRRVEVGQHELEVLDDDVGVVVTLQEPVDLIQVLFEGVLESQPRIQAKDFKAGCKPLTDLLS